jgi:hypothetical protein
LTVTLSLVCGVGSLTLADTETFLGGSGVGACAGVGVAGCFGIGAGVGVDADSCFFSGCGVLGVGAEFCCTVVVLELEFCESAAVLFVVLEFALFVATLLELVLFVDTSATFAEFVILEFADTLFVLFLGAKYINP